MKKCLILIAWMALLAACTQESDLHITPDIASFQFDADGGSFDVVLFTNGSWTATCDDAAVSFAPTSGDYTTPMHISIGANESYYTKSIRIALLTQLDGNSRSGKIVITQACRPFLFCEETLLRVPAAGGNVRFAINSNESWKVVKTTCDGDAVDLAVDPVTGGPNAVDVTVLIPENETGLARTFTVRLALESYLDKTLVLTVVQAAG